MTLAMITRTNNSVIIYEVDDITKAVAKFNPDVYKEFPQGQIEEARTWCRELITTLQEIGHAT